MTASQPAPRISFQDGDAWLERLGRSDIENLISAATDVALLIDRGGIIRDLAVGSEDLAREGCERWLGKPWIETVTIESRTKVKELLSNAPGRARDREINHPSRRGPDLPLRYCAVRVGNGEFVLALGRDLRNVTMLQQRLVETQQAMEREYSRIRLAETRYRMLFHMGSEPVIIVEAGTYRIVEANPAAQRMIAGPGGFPPNATLPGYFDAESNDALVMLLKSASIAGRADDVPLTATANGQAFAASASTFRQERSTYILVRLSTRAASVPADVQAMSAQVLTMIEQLPDGFVVVSPELQILEANRAFLDLGQLSSKAQAIGHDLGRWLGRPGIDLPRLISALAEHGSVRAFPTIVRGAFGGTEDVEVSAIAALGGQTPSYGFVIRSTGARSAIDANRPRALPRSVEQLTELVGRVSLKDLVRETTDVIERLCIEAALDLSNDNRASAAQMLGLSRQSFYAKLRRHGLGGFDDEIEEIV